LERTPDKAKSKDKGADTLQHFRYQHSYTCLLAVTLYAQDPELGLLFEEILCEQHEDILGVTKDRRFVGIQIKSRLKEIPFTLVDEEIKHSITRFLQLEREYRNQFTKFVIVSNCPFLDDLSGKSIVNLLNQMKLPPGIEIEFKPRDLEKFITSLIRNGYCREEIISVLRKVECQKGPGIDDIDSKVIENHIGKLRACENIPASTLRSIYDRLILLIFNASSVTEENKQHAHSKGLTKFYPHEIKLRSEQNISFCSFISQQNILSDNSRHNHPV
jgi:hypothetical protein